MDLLESDRNILHDLEAWLDGQEESIRFPDIQDALMASSYAILRDHGRDILFLLSEIALELNTLGGDVPMMDCADRLGMLIRERSDSR